MENREVIKRLKAIARIVDESPELDDLADWPDASQMALATGIAAGRLYEATVDASNLVWELIEDIDEDVKRMDRMREKWKREDEEAEAIEAARQAQKNTMEIIAEGPDV